MVTENDVALMHKLGLINLTCNLLLFIYEQILDIAIELYHPGGGKNLLGDEKHHPGSEGDLPDGEKRHRSVGKDHRSAGKSHRNGGKD